MNKLALSAIAIAIGCCPVNAQTKLIEKVTKKGNELLIPYEKYQLSNGLILLIHEDHSDPIVHVDITYHVGSAREQEGRSGFAHFFEHMLFQGSDNVKDDEHFKIVTASGGSLNGNTTTDRTKYFETMPSNQLATALWLEADRMGFFLDSVTQKKFEVQRATVKNERGQNYDNKPYGLVREKIGEALYPSGHPYSWSTIGYIEDLNRVDVNDLKKFFLRWYGPNNAVLTVAGDVKPAEVIQLTEKYFGTIPKGPEVSKMPPMPVKLDKDRYISYEDNIRFPMIVFSFPGVESNHPDEAALEALAEIMGDSKSSLFYQNFDKKQLSTQTNVYNGTRELAGEFVVSIRANKDAKLSTTDSLIRSTLNEFEKKGVTDDDLKRFKAGFESQLINLLSSVNGKAITITDYQTYTGNPNYIVKEMERYMNVTKEDIMRVYNTYVKNKPAVILSVYPKGKPELAAKPDNFTIPKRTIETKEGNEYKNLVYNKPKDNFNRAQKPAAGANPTIKLPAYSTETFANGLKIISARNEEIPTVILQLSIEAGHRYEEKSKAGIAELTAALMNESTLKHTAEQLGDELDKLGSSVNVGASENDIFMTISTLTKNLSATLRLAEEILLQPAFKAEDFERLKQQQLKTISNQVTQPNVIADNVYRKLLYGDNHILSLPLMGTTTSVETITLEDVKNYYNQHLSPNVSKLVVVGDVTKEQLAPQLEFLKNWKDKKVVHPAAPALPSIDKTRIYFVNKDNAPQSVIRTGYMAIPYDATGEYFKANVMNFALGATFNCRINMNLRETHGFAYGAFGRFGSGKHAAPYTVAAGVKANATDSSVTEVMKELKNYADNGITNEELLFTQSAMGQNDALKYETPFQKAGVLKRIIDFNLDAGYVDKQNNILKNITKDEVNAIAKKHIPYNNMIIVVVGDKTSNYEKLAKMGYEIIELDSQGNKIKN